MTSARNTQIKLLGKLAAKLESDPRSPIEVIEQYFLFTDEERGIFWNAYKGGDDPITADIR